MASASDDFAPVVRTVDTGPPGFRPQLCPVSPPSHLAVTLQQLEFLRERRWKQRGQTTELKLHWRAAAIQQLLRVVPGETILELGAGSGLLTAQLDSLFQGENSITSIIFSPDLFSQAARRPVRGVDFLPGDSLDDIRSGQFDYVIGSGMLWHSAFDECINWIYQVLKPGGQILFFEPNVYWPARIVNEMRSRPHALRNNCPNVRQALENFSKAGFDEVHLAPHDIVSSRLGVRWMTHLQAKAVLLEHMPGVNFACASLCVMARKQGSRVQPEPDLADEPSLYGAVSIVVPAHNEAANIPNLVAALFRSYGSYIHEIIIVNDNSQDNTADVAGKLAASDPRVRLINRSKPNGVGLALTDGYRAATGQYILSMDCDFIEILPQLRGLFRAVAAGHDGAIGSRFSHESILLNYPFVKLLFNRFCHVLIKLFLISSARDITNNLKLYRTRILQDLKISSPHFSANLETGLKPLLAGYDIIEVPISWINRTSEMGTSSFRIRKVGLAYASTLLSCWRENRTDSRGLIPLAWRRIVKAARRSSPVLL